jgi:hypothetical protein
VASCIAQTGDDLVRRDVALIFRHQLDEDGAGIDGPAAGPAAARARKARDVLDGRILGDVLTNCVNFFSIDWNEMLWSAWMTPNSSPVSSLGKNLSAR